MKNKKRIISIFILLSLVILIFTSCETPKNIDDNDYITFTADRSDFTYTHDEGNIISYCVDDNGNFYYFTNEYETDTKMPVNESKIFTMDLNGNLINDVKIGFDFPLEMVVENNLLYYIPAFTREIKICSADLNTGEVSTVHILDDFLEVKNMFIINNVLYFMGIEKKATAREYKLFDYSDNFFYYGDIIRSIDLSTGEMKDVFSELLINFSQMPNNNLMIYAYDENGGYYFQEYNIKDNIFNDKIYKKYDQLADKITDFTITPKNQIIFKSISILKLSDLNKEEAITEIANNAAMVFLNDKVIYKSGYLFYPTEQGVRRVLLETIFRSSVSLNMGFTHKGMDFPDNYGFFINNKDMNIDKIALSILAGDKDIDLYLINSRHNYADNIQKKGAYYKLNDVPNVAEYIDSLFPYLKDAAVNDNGDIWMIPVALGTYTVEYNQKVWDRYDLDIKSFKTLNDLIDKIYYLDEDNIDETYWINAHELILKYFYQLIENNNGFDREKFKEMAEYCYDKLNFVKNPIKEIPYGVLINKSTKTDIDSSTGGIYNGYIVDGEIAFGGGSYGTDSHTIESVIEFPDYDNYDEAKNDPNRKIFATANYSNLRRSSPPTIEGTNKNDLTCEFIYINPNSENLDTVLEYISEYCKQAINKRNSFILEDKSTYDDRVYINDYYDIFNGNNYIRFGLNTELFYDDFIKYLGDEITLDEYLKTIEYKISAYLNE